MWSPVHADRTRVWLPPHKPHNPCCLLLPCVLSQGTLREALDRNSFCSKSSSGGSSEDALLLPDLRTVLPLAVDIMSALVHLHSEGILHGDLKAANVLLSEATAPEADDGSSGLAGAAAAGGRRALRLVAKVADFGLSTALEAERTHISHVHGVRASSSHQGQALRCSDSSSGCCAWQCACGCVPNMQRRLVYVVEQGQGWGGLCDPKTGTGRRWFQAPCTVPPYP